VVSWLVRSSPERVVRVRALAGDIVLCSWAITLTVIVGENLTICDGLASCPGEKYS